jgi:hypothetical protein
VDKASYLKLYFKQVDKVNIQTINNMCNPIIGIDSWSTMKVLCFQYFQWNR